MTEEEKAALTVEIFDATGIAVDKDDPVVICALMQSHFMRQAQMQVTREIQHASEKALQAIKGASVTATEQIVQHTSRQIMAALSDAANTEADRLKNHLGKFAEGLKAKLNAVMGAPIEYDVSQSRFYTGAIAAIAIVGVAGVFVGSACFGSNKQLTVAEAQQLIIGREFLEVLPRLDQPTKQKLMRALKERERVHSK